MELIIKNKSQSFEQIVIDLNVYLRSLPDWESWQDYFKTGSGQTIIELIAGLGAQIFYFINIQRQENYLQTAMNRSSVIGISQMLGYSAGRGNAVKASITVTPNTSGVFNQFTIMGTCKNVDIIMAESVLLNEGESKTFNVILGTLKRDYCKILSSALQPFRMTKPNISEDFILYKTANTYTDNELEAISENLDYDKTGWIELPVSDKMIDLINDKYVVQTNVLSSVDIFYLNTGSGEHAYPYRQEETLFIDYVELSDTEFSINDLNFLYGDVTAVNSVASYNAVESLGSIKVNAPLANEVQALIRAREDAEKIIRNYGKNYLSATNSTDIDPETIDVTYIKNDYTILSDLEYSELYNYLFNKVRPFGINMPYISTPIRALLDLDIEVELSNPLVRNTVTSAIASMVKSLEGGFIVDNSGIPTQLDMGLIEQQVEDQYGVKTARIYINSTKYQSNTYYRVGQFVSGENALYKLESITLASGSTEPSWTTVSGEYVYDGSIKWICRDLIEGKGSTWQANSAYRVSNIVLPTEDNGCMYEFNGYIGESGDIAPALSTTDVVYDNNLIWFKIDRNASATNWQSNTEYAVGKIINLNSDSEFSYQMIGLRAKSSNEDVVWPTAESIANGGSNKVQIGNMIWKYYRAVDDRGNYKNPLLDYEWNQYLHVDYNLHITE